MKILAWIILVFSALALIFGLTMQELDGITFVITASYFGGVIAQSINVIKTKGENK